LQAPIRSHELLTRDEPLNRRRLTGVEGDRERRLREGDEVDPPHRESTGE